MLRLSYGGASFLLTSEVSDKATRTLLNSGQYLGATVLQLPSNGRVSPDEWRKAARPQVVVIEAEEGNQKAQPDDSLLKRLNADQIPVYRTDRNGTIEIATDGKQLWISASRRQ